MAELLVRPLLRRLDVSGRSRSFDCYDVHSANYLGLRVIDGVVDFETGERDLGDDAKAESVGELIERP